jgi:hypothetical protein
MYVKKRKPQHLNKTKHKPLYPTNENITSWKRELTFANSSPARNIQIVKFWTWWNVAKAMGFIPKDLSFLVEDAIVHDIPIKVSAPKADIIYNDGIVCLIRTQVAHDLDSQGAYDRLDPEVHGATWISQFGLYLWVVTDPSVLAEWRKWKSKTHNWQWWQQQEQRKQQQQQQQQQQQRQQRQP